MADIKDVARRAGVSIATVSNVINQKKPVSLGLQSRVLEAVEALNYEANPVGRGLKSNRTNQIGVIVPSFNQVFFPAILKGIHEAGLKYGYRVLVFETNSDIQKEREHVRSLQHAWIDGIILASYANQENPSEREYIRSLGQIQNSKKKIPVVTLENVLDPGLDAVIVDNEKAAEKAVSHLISLGHQKIAHIAGPRRFQIGERRLIGYQKTLRNAGIIPNDDWVTEGDFSPISGYGCMKELLEKDPSITAVFAANDQMAIGAMRALMDAGKRIPEDVAVIGLDNNFPSTLVSPSLSSVNLPKYEMGFQAVELLVSKIDNPERPAAVIILETDLIVRKSTSNLGADNWNLYNW